MARHQTGRIQIEFDLVNDAFQGAGRAGQIAWTLRDLANMIENDGMLEVDGTKPDAVNVYDENGNCIGACYYRTKRRQRRKGEV